MATLLKEINVGYATGNWYLRLYEDSISQSIEGNSTNVNLRITLRADSSTWVAFDNRDAWIQGTHFSIAYRHDNPEHNLGTMTLKVNHNTDGSGSYSVGFGIATSFALNGNSSGGRTLPTIPRASNFSVSSENVIGSSMSVTITRASTNFTHTVRYQFGSIIREYNKQATSCVFTPPYEDGSQIPNAMSGTGTITVYTYNGSTFIGSKSESFTQRVNGSVFAPTFSELQISRVDNGVPDDWGIYVQGKSKATINIVGATAKYGATIVSYAITAGGFNGGNNLTAGPFSSGIITITGKITDSRGIITTRVSQISVYENTPPTLTLKAERCNSTGIVSNEGTYIKVTPTFSCASVNGMNYITSKTFKITGTSYQNTTGTSDSSFILGSNDMEVSKAYSVTGVIGDALGQSSNTITVNIPTSSVPFHIRENQDGIAFGKYSERVGIDSAWDIYLKGKNMIDLIVPVGCIIHNKLSGFNPNVLYAGTTWVRYAQGKVLVGVNENDADFNVVEKSGGNKSSNNVHTHTTGNCALSIAQMPLHGLHLFNGNSSANWLGHGNTGYYFSSGKATSATGVRGWYLQAGNELYPCGETQGAGQIHNHGITGTADCTQSVLQPYITVYMWVRTA